MKKQFSLPPKNTIKTKSATEAQIVDGSNDNLLGITFPINVTNLKRDFEAQAKEIKNKIVLGKTPERLEKPKVDLSLDSRGFLKGDITATKETGDTETVDLVDRAKAVNEGVKKPVFKKKTAEETLVNTTTDGQSSVKDERESEDKEPKEAVACEGRFPAFNKRERDLIDSRDPNKVRSEIRAGNLSKVRGNQILYSMGASEAFDTLSKDAGTIIEPVEEEFKPTEVAENPHGFTLEGIIDTEVADEMGCDVKYTRKAPLTGSVGKLNLEKANQVKDVFESYGVSARIVASAKEEYSVMFNEEPEAAGTRWYVLVKDTDNANRVNELTLTTSDDATKEEIAEYLAKTYAPENILRISTDRQE